MKRLQWGKGGKFQWDWRKNGDGRIIPVDLDGGVRRKTQTWRRGGSLIFMVKRASRRRGPYRQLNIYSERSFDDISRGSFRGLRRWFAVDSSRTFRVV